MREIGFALQLQMLHTLFLLHHNKEQNSYLVLRLFYKCTFGNGEIILELCIYLLGMGKNLPSDLHALTLMIQNQTLLALKHINWNNLKREKGILSSMEENFRKHSMTYGDRQSSYLFFKKKKIS